MHQACARKLLSLLPVAAVMLLGGGCSKMYIPNTDVEDTDENRKIVEFCEVYRRAVERKDIESLVALASKQYYEDGGNVDASDDIDYAGLREYLRGKFDEARGIRYEIRYRRVSQDEEFILVDYTYSGSVRLPSQDGEQWKSTVEENRLELVATEDSFHIVRGM